MVPARFVLGMALLLSCIVIGAVPGAAETETQAREARSLPSDRPLRLGYYYPADAAAHQSLSSNLGRMDIVSPHWLNVDELGEVRSHIRLPDTAVNTLRTTRSIVLPSVMVTNRAAGSAILNDPGLSATTIENLLVAIAPWDGIALDFEGLDPADRPHLTRFIHDLGAALRTAGKIYAIALPAKTQDARTGWSGAYDYRAIANAADLYLVMAYGYAVASSPPGSTAPMRWVAAAMNYAVSEIPRERLILGLPFYGYDWNLTQGPPARALRHDQVKDLIEATGATPALDGSGSRSFRYESNGDSHEVWYEDAESLALKLNLVNRLRLGGAGVWRLGQEDPGFWSVWDRTLGRAPTADVSITRMHSPLASRVLSGRPLLIYPW
jgi:spore germination protein YaaH